MADRLTLDRIRTFDQLRSVRSITTSLKLNSTSLTAYAVLETITYGWYHEYLQDAETGEEFMQILVCETSEWSKASMDKIGAITIDGRRYTAKVRLRPSGAPLVWQIRAAPTGETV